MVFCVAFSGWALTLLSKENLSYASTAQTVGLNTGYFLSFTVFLAFNSVEFRYGMVPRFRSVLLSETDRPFPSTSNKYFRSTPLDYPLVSLSGYLHFWAVAFIAVTAYLAFFQPEVSLDPTSPHTQTSCNLEEAELNPIT
jgi:PAT family acetyl-CoA transporter-like MFS transporter 1